jgi:hypothetical protein
MKPQKIELVDNPEGPIPLSVKINDEVKQLIEPFNMAILKPIGEITPECEDEQLNIKQGSYYYFPHFQDTRIYRKYSTLSIIQN